MNASGENHTPDTPPLEDPPLPDSYEPNPKEVPEPEDSPEKK